MKTVASLLIVCLAACLLAGCPKKPNTMIEPVAAEDYERQLPPGKMGLAKVDPKDIPDFTAACSDLKDLRKAVDYSLDYMSKPSSRIAYQAYGTEFTHERALASLRAFAALLDSNPSPGRLNSALREQFDVYTSVGWNMRGDVRFTGYYTPIFDASPVRTDRFRYPIYRPPTDLQKGPDGTILTTLPPRKELEASGKLQGLELYWLGDPFEVYIAHVQGSAKLRMADGKLITVGYTAHNGHDYRSAGKDMVAEGKIPKGGLSLRAMINYFKAHPNEIAEYTGRNPRFVFFAETASEPRGSLNEPVTTWRSLAVDKAIFPRAAVTFFAAGMPKRAGAEIGIQPYTGFALDQDTGNAIRAPGRCDVYMGIGDEAGELAGRTQENGRLYYLFLKPGLAKAATPAALPPAALPPAALPPAAQPPATVNP